MSKQSKFNLGDTVYNLYDYAIHEYKIESIEGDYKGWRYRGENNIQTNGNDETTFKTRAEAERGLEKAIQDELKRYEAELREKEVSNEIL